MTKLAGVLPRPVVHRQEQSRSRLEERYSATGVRGPVQLAGCTITCPGPGSHRINGHLVPLRKNGFGLVERTIPGYVA